MGQRGGPSSKYTSMKTNITHNERTDQIDRDRFRTMVNSDSFKIIWGRVESELKRAQEACTRCEGTEIYRAQGSVLALQGIVSLPEIILKEMEPKPLVTPPAYKKKANISLSGVR